MKTAREKQHFAHRGKTIRATVSFSSETVEAGRKRHTIFQGPKGKNCQPGVIHPANTSFKNEREIRTFLGEGKRSEFVLRADLP